MRNPWVRRGLWYASAHQATGQELAHLSATPARMWAAPASPLDARERPSGRQQ